ncbi:MAG: type III pantothenate kinase [Chthoniobacterales bacterium]
MPRAVSHRPADYLLVDISNSFTKLAYASRKRLGRSVRVPTGKLSVTKIGSMLRRRPVRTIVVSSVVPQKNHLVRRVACQTPILFLTPHLHLGVGVDYPAPASIGADRLANAAAVAQLYGFPAIVVDFGTAVTFDVVSSRGDYIGGVIAPGLESMTNFLYQRTALLPKLSLHEPTAAVGKSTRSAMMAGAIFGYRGLVREILLRIRAEEFRRQKVQVVATGGYAELIAQQLPEIESVHPNLTMEGLRIVGNLNVAL